MFLFRLLFLILVGSAPLSATVKVVTPNDVAANSSDGVAADRELAQRLSDSERRNLILEAKSELEAKAYDRFSLLMAAIGGLITLLVVGFGIFTHRAAVTAARQELADLKDKLNLLHQDAAAAKEKAFEAAETARQAAEGAQAHQQRAQEASEIVGRAAILAGRLQPEGVEGPGEILSAAERETVSEAAKEVADKPESQWSPDEFRIGIAEAYAQGNWEEMLRLSRGMEFLYGHEPESLAFALLRRGWALSRLGRSDEAGAVYDEVADRFMDSDNPEIRATVANAIFNKAVRLGALGKSTEEIGVYDDLLAKFDTTDDPEILLTVAKAMVNKGVRVAEAGSPDEEIRIYDKLIARFSNFNILEFMEQVGFAIENKGITLTELGRHEDAVDAFNDLVARFEEDEDERLKKLVRSVTLRIAKIRGTQGRVRACLNALEDWKVFSGGIFDCEVIAAEDFDPVRIKPTFVKFLRANGCAV